MFRCKKFFVIVILLLSLKVSAQDEWFHAKNGEWSRARTFLRAGVGFQKSGYSEVGLARMKMMQGEMPGSFALRSFYTSLEWTPAFLPEKPKNILGWKAGYEGSFVVLAYGLEMKYQTDFLLQDAVLTPKLGLNFVYVSMHYGYNISFLKTPFADIGRHQFSLIFQYNRKVFKEVFKK